MLAHLKEDKDQLNFVIFDTYFYIWFLTSLRCEKTSVTPFFLILYYNYIVVEKGSKEVLAQQKEDKNQIS